MDERELYLRLIELLPANDQARVRQYIADNEGTTYAQAIEFMRDEFPLRINDGRAVFEPGPARQANEPAGPVGRQVGEPEQPARQVGQPVGRQVGEPRTVVGTPAPENPYLAGGVLEQALAEQNAMLDLQLASAGREFDLFLERANSDISDLNQRNELSETARRIAEHSQRRSTLGSFATAGIGDSGVAQRARQQAATQFGLETESADLSYASALRGIDEAIDDAEFDFNFVTQLLASQNSSLIGGLL